MRIFYQISQFWGEHPFWKIFFGTILGAGIGYLFYRWIGCRSGGCPLTANPYFSSLWGALFGFFLTLSWQPVKPIEAPPQIEVSNPPDEQKPE